MRQFEGVFWMIMMSLYGYLAMCASIEVYTMHPTIYLFNAFSDMP